METVVRPPPCLAAAERPALFADRALGVDWLDSGYVICSGPVASPIFLVRQRLTRTFIIQLFTCCSFRHIHTYIH